MEDLPLDRTATLVPAFAAKDLPWAEHSDDNDDDDDDDEDDITRGKQQEAITPICP